jgi:uncharacterized protein YbaR (Trm112 family)
MGLGFDSDHPAHSADSVLHAFALLAVFATFASSRESLCSCRYVESSAAGPMLAPMSETQTIDPELLSMLVCPLSRRPLALVGNRLLCYESRKAYRIDDGIPIMLVEEATDIPESELPDLYKGKPAITAPEQYPAE